MSEEKTGAGADCIIEAGTVMTGLAADGRMQLRHDVGIRVEKGMIAQIGPLEAVGYGNDHLPRHGSAAMIAMPGLVNSHHHFGLTPLMMGVPFAPLELWLPRFRAMRPVGPRLDTLYAAIEMLESGTTTVHHIASGLTGTPEAWESSTDAVLGAYQEIGMRTGYSFMMRDRNVLAYEPDSAILAGLPADLADWLKPRLAAADVPTAEYMAFFKASRAKWQERNPLTLRHHLAPANLHWCSDDSLQMIFETARASGANVHMHLLETKRQAGFARARYGRSAVEHLAALGCLGPELTIGHGNWASESDLDLLADCGCMVCHNASSGLRLGSGIAPVNAMRRRGIPVALGIDQSNLADDRDMLLEMKLVWALHRGTDLFNDRPDAAAVLQMATEHGARSTGYGGMVGRLEPGQRADIVLLKRESVARPYLHPDTPVSEAVLHRAMKDAVHQVFVEGHKLVDGGRVVSIDRDAVLREIAERLAQPETASEQEASRMVARLMPALEQVHRDHPL
ncbi:amidohydrolase family protein [Rhizobium paknamense]|uniref:Cytosine/adenosine deaminase-related metal-dependent hydrolase n=1 Tax=Rhizobium paknamense TaxID=1206817 RepID=A0ABU0IF37_9HYPH|nr:amidohydrolase family protein [Rhizobium paknamense]MDQ0456844.1 cytosine/adenosine deaminase-related metal-dependent hydrolase [Rhizobium paknamense]